MGKNKAIKASPKVWDRLETLKKRHPNKTYVELLDLLVTHKNGTIAEISSSIEQEMTKELLFVTNSDEEIENIVSAFQFPAILNKILTTENKQERQDKIDTLRKKMSECIQEEEAPEDDR